MKNPFDPTCFEKMTELDSLIEGIKTEQFIFDELFVSLYETSRLNEKFTLRDVLNCEIYIAEESPDPLRLIRALQGLLSSISDVQELLIDRFVFASEAEQVTSPLEGKDDTPADETGLIQ